MTYFNVPYGRKDEAKEAGARWDAERKGWYAKNAKAETEMYQLGFSSIEPPEPVRPADPAERVYFYVPFAQKHIAKSANAKWDGERKAWYAPTAQIKAEMEMNGFAETDPAFATAYFVPFRDRDVARDMGADWDKDAKAWVARSEHITNLLSTRFARADSAEGRAARAAESKHRAMTKLDTRYYVQLPRGVTPQYARLCGAKFDSYDLPYVADCEALAGVEAKGWGVVSQESENWHDYAMKNSARYHHSFTM